MTAQPLQHHPLACLKTKPSSLFTSFAPIIFFFLKKLLVLNRTAISAIPLNVCECVFHWLRMYPLIRDRCGPLGSHQAGKKLDPPPPLFSLSPLPRHCTTSPCLCTPLKSHITHRCQRKERLTDNRTETEQGESESSINRETGGVGERRWLQSLRKHRRVTEP